MAKIILTADVEDGAAWERAFRTHGDLFKANGIGVVEYTLVDGGHVVMCTDTDDVGAYMDFVNAPETQEAMKHDGVKRETVKVAVLDKSLRA